VGAGFQIIADVEVTEAEAPGLAASVVGWLTAEGIIAAELTDYVLGAESGYAPGPRYTAAVTEPGEWLLELRSNGVEVCTSRNVFIPFRGGAGPVACPRCGQTVELEDPATGQPTARWDLFSDALDTWMAGGSGAVTCPRCGQVTAFNDWLWLTRFLFAIGFLGFTFCTWPELSELFVAQMRSHLGHRVVLTGGKL
jgi:uncharacterized Zn-finger protein